MKKLNIKKNDIKSIKLLDKQTAETLQREQLQLGVEWWLCSGGYDSNFVMCIELDGTIGHYGIGVDNKTISVRPVITFNEKELSEYQLYEQLQIQNTKWKKLTDSLIISCDDYFGTSCYNTEGNGNTYEGSVIQKHINRKLDELLQMH